jgi:hypothetical protein
VRGEERRGRVEVPSDVRERHDQEVLVVPRAEEHLQAGESQEGCKEDEGRSRRCGVREEEQ